MYFLKNLTICILNFLNIVAKKKLDIYLKYKYYFIKSINYLNKNDLMIKIRIFKLYYEK